MGLSLCARLDDPSGSLHAHLGPQGTALNWHLLPSQAPALTDAVAMSSLSCLPAAAAGMLSWARGFAILYTTRMAAWILSLGCKGLFLAALHPLQIQ